MENKLNEFLNIFYKKLNEVIKRIENVEKNKSNVDD